jgi:hypothetical protein
MTEEHESLKSEEIVPASELDESSLKLIEKATCEEEKSESKSFGAACKQQAQKVWTRIGNAPAKASVKNIKGGPHDEEFFACFKDLLEEAIT